MMGRQSGGGWVGWGMGGMGVQRKLQVSLPPSMNQILLQSDNRAKRLMSMHNCTGR